MRKPLLLCGLLLSAFAAVAAEPTFSDFAQIKCGDKVYANGETITATKPIDEYNTASIDVKVINLTGEDIKVTGALMPTGTPTLDQINNEGDKWGMPSFCFIDIPYGAGNCFGGDNTTFGKGSGVIHPDSDFEWQVHVYEINPAQHQTYKLVNIITVTIPAADEDSEPEELCFEQSNILEFAAAASADTILDASAPAQYFDIAGREISNPTQGIYVVRQGGKTFKQVIK